MFFHCMAALMDETINCPFSSAININAKGMGSFQASANLQSLQYILQHISKIHTVCMKRGEINQCHISGLWVTVVPPIMWEMWKRGRVTRIWQKQWLIFITFWEKIACYLIVLQEIIFRVSFFDLRFESFFRPFFFLPILQCFIEWNRRHKPGSIWENRCWDHPRLLIFVSGHDYGLSLRSVLIWPCFRTRFWPLCSAKKKVIHW